MTVAQAKGWDGTSLYYELSGQPVGSASAVVLNDGIGCDGFIWKHLKPCLQKRFTVLHWNYRGHGQSGRAAQEEHYRIDDVVRDLSDVMDAAGVQKAIHLGHSMGVQISLEASLSLAERVTGLVLMCGSHGRPLDTFMDTGAGKRLFPMLSRVVRRYDQVYKRVMQRFMPTELGWVIARIAEVDGQLLSREDFLPYLEHLANMEPKIFLTMLEDAAKHSTEQRLSSIQVPVLVLGGQFDNFTPFWVSEVIGRAVPTCEVHMIRGGSHTAPLEQYELTELLVDDWMHRMELR